MIDVQILGTEQVAKALRERGELFPRNVRTWTDVALTDMQSYVMWHKLTGGTPLNARSGKLRDSIHKDVNMQANEVVGRLYSNMGRNSYAGIHEYGAVFERQITQIFGRKLHEIMLWRTFHYPQRSYLRSTLMEKRPQVARALRQALKDTLAGRES